MRHLGIALIGALGFAWTLLGAARSSEAVDWGFESSGAGWAAFGGTFSTSAPPYQGAGAARLVAATSGQALSLRSAYWLVPTVPGAQLSGSMWVHASSADFSSVSAELRAFRSGGDPIAVDPIYASLNGAYTRLDFPSQPAPEGATFLSVVVVAQPRRAGAELHIDSVSVIEVRPTPAATTTTTATSTASATATGTATGTATSSATATSTATSTVTATATRTATTTATATRSPTALATPAAFAALTNGDFEDARRLYGWAAQGGTADAGHSFISPSTAAVLTSNSNSTKWLHQAVAVVPGGWYAASARLGALGPDDEVWLRLAWYPSTDGSGAQLEVVDSPSAPAGGGVLALGPARAPANARSVRVRLVLRPASGAPTLLAADDVSLGSVPALLPSPTVSPTPGATAAPSIATPAPASGRAPSNTAPANSVAIAATGRVEGRTQAGGSSRMLGPHAPILRITELLPDPVQEGPDADYEWVEVANLGGASASLRGFALRDNFAAVELPDLELGPGGVLVVAAPRADVGAAALVHLLEGAIGNGLGNGGDRLALMTPEGEVLDAVSWGADRAHTEGVAPVPAPGAGRSLLRRFTDDGSLVAVERLDVPTPGRADDALVRVGDNEPAHLSVVAGTQDRWWLALLALAAVGLVWTVVLRARELRGDGAD